MSNLIARFEDELGSRFDAKLDELIAAHERAHEINLAVGGASTQTGGAVKEYQTVSPEAKHKLRGILQHYAKEVHPFTACVRDNTKRFGPDRAARVCAVLKDIIYGTTKWRGKDNPAGVGPHPYVGMSDTAPIIDADVVDLVDRLDEMELWDLLGLAALEDQLDDKTAEFRTFTATQREALAKGRQALPDGSFPIANTQDLKNAISAHGRAKNKAAVKTHIVKRAKSLGVAHMLPSGWA